MDTDSSDAVHPGLQPVGEAELTVEAGDVRVTIRGPERADDPTEWSKALPSALAVWEHIFNKVHSARLEEIKAEQGGRLGPGQAGFVQEGMHERRNETLPGGTGARPV